MKRPLLVFLGVLTFGCYDGGDSQYAADGEGDAPDGAEYTDEMPDDLPAAECRDSSADPEECEGSESSGAANAAPASDGAFECASTDACDGAGACVAVFADGARGPFSCRFACVPTLDESTWCSDDASCCDDDARCTPRGYCVVASAPRRTNPSEDDPR